MNIKGSIIKLQVNDTIAQILENKYELNCNQDHPQLSTDEEQFLSYFLDTKKILQEFGYENEEEIARNFTTIWTRQLRLKCLILENYQLLDDVINNSKDLFQDSVAAIYAKINCYNYLKQKQEKITERMSIRGFIRNDFSNLESVTHINREEMLKMFPLTPKKIRLFEHIHEVKKAAKNKSESSSL